MKSVAVVFWKEIVMNQLITKSQFDLLAAKADAKIQAVEAKADAALSGNISSDTKIVSVTGGLQLAIGDNQPLNKSVWLDTSDYASENGAIQTYSSPVSGGNMKFVASDTKPSDTSVAWINTADYST